MYFGGHSEIADVAKASGSSSSAICTDFERAVKVRQELLARCDTLWKRDIDHVAPESFGAGA